MTGFIIPSEYKWFWVTRKSPSGGIVEPALIAYGKVWLTTWQSGPKEFLKEEDFLILAPCLPPTILPAEEDEASG